MNGHFAKPSIRSMTETPKDLTGLDPALGSAVSAHQSKKFASNNEFGLSHEQEGSVVDTNVQHVTSLDEKTGATSDLKSVPFVHLPTAVSLPFSASDNSTVAFATTPTTKSAPRLGTSSVCIHPTVATEKKILSCNPYKRKTVTPIVKQCKRTRYSYAEEQRLKEPLDLPHYCEMRPVEKFAAALLRTSPADFVACEEDDEAAGTSNLLSSPDSRSWRVWEEICHRLNIAASIPKHPLPDRFDLKDEKLHFESRATLVLEEARKSISQPLASLWHKGAHELKRNKDALIVRVSSMEKDNATGHVNVTLQEDKPFTAEQANQIRCATVYQCLCTNQSASLRNVILGWVSSGVRRCDQLSLEEDDDDEGPLELKSRQFSMYWLRDIPDGIEYTEWILTPISTLISELRSFEALTSASTLDIPFLSDLLGHGGKNRLEEDSIDPLFPSDHCIFSSNREGNNGVCSLITPSSLPKENLNSQATHAKISSDEAHHFKTHQRGGRLAGTRLVNQREDCNGTTDDSFCLPGQTCKNLPTPVSPPSRAYLDPAVDICSRTTPVITPAPRIGTSSVCIHSTVATEKKILPCNPYKKKPLRPLVQNCKRNRISFAEEQRLKEPLDLPHYCEMRPVEKFAAALLRTSPADFVACEKDDDAAGTNNLLSRPESRSWRVWEEICHRLNIATSIPKHPLPDRYDMKDQELHFESRATLVLEEARKSISQPLASLWHKGAHELKKNKDALIVRVSSMEKNNATGHVRVTLQADKPFTAEQANQIRCATVYQCLCKNQSSSLSNVILGLVYNDADEITRGSKHGQFSMLWFRDIPDHIEDTQWVVTRISYLISHLGYFETLGIGVSSSYGSIKDDGSQHRYSMSSSSRTTESSSVNPRFFRIPLLNERQHHAADTFLHSAPNTITLIQGPPGTGMTLLQLMSMSSLTSRVLKSHSFFVVDIITGKTTLLVSIICRYLSDPTFCDRRGQLLVCAPTNKAITVLAKKFMDAIVTPDYCPYNVLIIGDGDKLLEEDHPQNTASGAKLITKRQSSLSSVFLHSWLLTVIKDFYRIKNYPFANQRKTQRSLLSKNDLHTLAHRLELKLRFRLPNLPESILDKAAEISLLTGKIKSGHRSNSELNSTVSLLLKDLRDLNKNFSVVQKDLISSANVLFCTLVSAGGMCLKGHSVADMIVDESAAATEATLSIPFFMTPRRMVGGATIKNWNVVEYVAHISCHSSFFISRNGSCAWVTRSNFRPPY